MKLFVHLEDTMNGTSGVYEYDLDDQYLDNLSYMWGFGNYSCDCNRSSFLSQTVEDYDTDLDCGDGYNQIMVEKILDEQGNLLYSDDWD